MFLPLFRLDRRINKKHTFHVSGIIAFSQATPHHRLAVAIPVRCFSRSALHPPCYSCLHLQNRYVLRRSHGLFNHLHLRPLHHITPLLDYFVDYSYDVLHLGRSSCATLIVFAVGSPRNIPAPAECIRMLEKASRSTTV